MRLIALLFIVTAFTGCFGSDEGPGDGTGGDGMDGGSDGDSGGDSGSGGDGSGDTDALETAEEALKALEDAGVLDALKGFAATATGPEGDVEMEAEFGSNGVSRFTFSTDSDGETQEGAVWCSAEQIVIESDGTAYAIPNQGGQACDASQYTGFVATPSEYHPDCDVSTTPASGGTQITVHCDERIVDGQESPEIDATVLVDGSGQPQSMHFASGDGTVVDVTFEYGPRQALTMPDAQSIPGWP